MGLAMQPSQPAGQNLVSMERHLTVAELAALWKLSEQTITDLFRDLEGVLKISNKRTPGARDKITLRIPLSLAERFHRERSRGFSELQPRRRRV